jgi:hypothetical protein
LHVYPLSPQETGIKATRIYALNKDVDRINEAELAKLKGEPIV